MNAATVTFFPSYFLLYNTEDWITKWQMYSMMIILEMMIILAFLGTNQM